MECERYRVQTEAQQVCALWAGGVIHSRILEAAWPPKACGLSVEQTVRLCDRKKFSRLSAHGKSSMKNYFCLANSRNPSKRGAPLVFLLRVSAQLLWHSLAMRVSFSKKWSRCVNSLNSSWRRSVDRQKRSKNEMCSDWSVKQSMLWRGAGLPNLRPKYVPCHQSVAEGHLMRFNCRRTVLTNQIFSGLVRS
jgi:hypothetical protein